ncbi:MAG: polysaccharide biosynthesis protein [Oscillospiraceae bacterium]|nr:polysaccharide biosynthesis protein [Oscillospiraceae bacterium]
MKFDPKSLTFSITILMATQIFSQILNFIFRVALARLVGAEGMGLYQLIMPVYSVTMSITVFGLTVAVARMSASYSAKGNHIAVRQAVRLSIWSFLLLFGLMAAFIIPFSDWISVTLLSDARTRLGLLLLLPCIFFTGFENLYKNYFYGMREVRPPAVTEVCEQLLRTGCVLLLLIALRPAYLEWTVGVIVIGMVLCEVVSSAMLCGFYLRHSRRLPARGERLSDKTLFTEMFRIAVPVSGATLAGNLLSSINTIIIPGRLIVSGMGQSEALSAYGVAFGMTLPLTMLPSVFVIPLSLTMMPRAAQSAALNDRAALQKQIKKTLWLTALLVIPACLLLIPFGKPILALLFKGQSAGRFVEILAVTEIFACFQYITNSLLNGAGKQKQAAVNVLVSDAIQLALTWYLVAIPDLRLWGFAASYLVTTALCATLNCLEALKDLSPESKHRRLPA